jgi:hypothetical protein
MADIDPHVVFNEVSSWLAKSQSESRENAEKTILPS